jgi:hypothetical protein
MWCASSLMNLVLTMPKHEIIINIHDRSLNIYNSQWTFHVVFLGPVLGIYAYKVRCDHHWTNAHDDWHWLQKGIPGSHYRPHCYRCIYASPLVILVRIWAKYDVKWFDSIRVRDRIIEHITHPTPATLSTSAKSLISNLKTDQWTYYTHNGFTSKLCFRPLCYGYMWQSQRWSSLDKYSPMICKVE